MLESIKPIKSPLEPYEIMAKDTECDGTCPIDVVVAISLDTLFAGIEETNDYVSEAITGHSYLQDIGYEPLGAYDGEVLMRVTGYVDAEDIEDELD